MSIDRAELERLLADRPTGNRSAMQAVRESYADIGLMRERGLSWAEISDVLAKLGVTARDNQPISPVTLRSAFFLVGNEGRDGGADGEEERETTPRETLDAVHRAALAAGQPDAVEPDDTEDAAADPEAELVPALEPEPDADPEPAPEEVSPDPAPAPALPVTPLAEPAKSLDEPAPIPQEPILTRFNTSRFDNEHTLERRSHAGHHLRSQRPRWRRQDAAVSPPDGDRHARRPSAQGRRI
ncbi:hypothetical protein [Azospirillum brasilense]|uniref:hypothetical protein n=1 Tax=Azospirillum brasilense TaxID=192 RepID=UPI00298E4D63|nr:hypothetical protein [Azospirillum brasilense]MDW7629059.1 hypothetical protein [Azospirillum brasilense]